MLKNILIAIALVTFTACQSTQKSEEFYPYTAKGERLEKRPAPVKSRYTENATPTEKAEEIADIPVPNGFEYMVDKSLRNHTNFQASKLRYERRSPSDDVLRLVNFYETELPKRGWKIEFIIGRRTKKILANKPGKDLEIVLFRKYRTSTSVIIAKQSEGHIALR